MDFSLFLRGLIIGFSIAAPVGPIGILCIRRSLANGAPSGFISGLGAAAADALYGSIAAFGLTAVSSLLVSGQNLLRLAGGVFLGYLGVRILLARPASVGLSAVSPPASPGLAADFASTFALTLTNPMTILSFTLIFSSLGVAATGGSYLTALMIVLGVFSGSALWWLLLAGLASGFRARFLRPAGLVWVNRLSGAIIAGFGLALLAGLLAEWL
jgi:threonine/homoserine/homoserine lactone efflux protein